MERDIKEKHYRTFRIHSRGPVKLDSIVGKFRGRNYRIKGIDKKNGMYRFLLANPDLILKGNHSAERIIHKIELYFRPEKEGYSVEAVCSLAYIEADKIIKGMGRHQTNLNKEKSEIKFGKGVQKTLIRILEEQ